MSPKDDGAEEYDPDATGPIPVVDDPHEEAEGTAETDESNWDDTPVAPSAPEYPKWPDPEELLVRYRRFGVSQLPRWQNLYESFTDPEQSRRRSFRSDLYMVILALTAVLFGGLALFSRLPVWGSAVITLLFGLALVIWGRAVSIREDKYRAKAWQKAAVEAFVKAAYRSRDFGKNMRITAHQLRRMAYTLKEGTLRICYVSRDHPIDLTRRIWLCGALIVGLIVAFSGIPELRSAENFAYLCLAIVLLAGVGWYLALKWWYWALLITDEYVRLVRVPPVWFPWMKVIDVPLPMRSIREVEAVYTRFGGLIGYGHVKIGTDMQSGEDSQTRMIRFMSPHDRIADIITREMHRDEDELLEEMRRLNTTVDERLPQAKQAPTYASDDVHRGADWGRDSW